MIQIRSNFNLSNKQYARMIESEEYIMDVADTAASSTDERLTHDDVFDLIREKING